MNQEEKTGNYTANENDFDSTGEDQDTENIATGSAESVSVGEVENLPVESIGSYARLDELLTDEKEENTNNPTTQT